MNSELDRKVISVIGQIIDRVEKDLPMFVTIVFDDGENTLVVSGSKDVPVPPTLVCLSDLQNRLIRTLLVTEGSEDD
jgi:hypothetical protein